MINDVNSSIENNKHEDNNSDTSEIYFPLSIDTCITKRGKRCYICDNSYQYNFHRLNKDNTSTYRCKEYENKCHSTIKVDNNNNFITSNNEQHNHPGNKEESIYI